MTARTVCKAGISLILNRKELLNLAAATSLAASARESTDDRPTPRPNILVFMTDDHGQWASQPYGNHELSTPNMSFLAATGARMMNAYTPCPVCSPARACFWTGRIPSQHGIHDWIKEDGDRRHWMARERTLSAVLRDAGYETGLAGKWHCGQGEIPTASFDSWCSHRTNQYPHRGEQHFLENGRPVLYTGHQSALVTSKALQFLRNRDRAKPFFLFVGYVDTHSPWQDHPERLVARYRGARFSDIPRERYAGRARVRFGDPRDGKARRERLAQYYAAVTNIDEQMGFLLDEVEGRGELDNTLVVYTSDHGHMNGHHGLWTKGNATVPQNFLEESIRVPLLLRWPGRIPAGRTIETPVDHCDLFQTLLEVGGATESGEHAARRHSPGRSFLAQISTGQDSSWRDEQICEYGNARMIRTDRYKLIVRYPPHAPTWPDELYDLQTDTRETTNRIDDSALSPTTRDLRERLDAYFGQYEEQGRSGRDVSRLPFYSGAEPWREDV